MPRDDELGNDDRQVSRRLPALPEYERKFQAKFGREMTAEEKRCYQLTRTGALPVKVKKKAADGSEVEETV